MRPVHNSIVFFNRTLYRQYPMTFDCRKILNEHMESKVIPLHNRFDKEGFLQLPNYGKLSGIFENKL
jgi:hypothetical protein